MEYGQVDSDPPYSNRLAPKMISAGELVEEESYSPLSLSAKKPFCPE
jgi:hypothetical protein